MCTTVLVLVFSMSGVCLVQSPFLLGDKQEVKFGGVMSAYNTHNIPASVFHFHVYFIVIP